MRAFRNTHNSGFAAAANQGLAAAGSSVLVLLNNDVVVPNDWLRRLVVRLEDDSLGAIGPVTNRIGTEAEVDVDYTTYGEFLDAARERRPTPATS